MNWPFKFPRCILIIADKLSGISASSQDYGMWERGDKTNQGITEINASSIGMAKVSTVTHKHTHTSLIPVISVILGWGECWEAGRWSRVPSENRAGALAGRKVSSHRDGLYTDHTDL